MSYNVSIPQVTDPILQSQQQIRANFQAINNAFSENHLSLTGDQSIAGMHSVLTLRPQTNDPVTSATQIAIYNKLIGDVPQLFYAPSSAQTPIQLTNSNIKTGLQSTRPDVYFAEQYTFVAGPFTIYGGLLTSVTHNFPVTLTPATTLIYVGCVAKDFPTTGNFNPQVIPTNIAGNSFNINYAATTPEPLKVYYLAIGV